MKKYLVITFLLITAVFAGGQKFSGTGFFELSYTDEADKDVTNEFKLNRIYFTYEMEISESVSYKFQTDIGRKEDDGRLEVYLKNAKLSWKTDFGKFEFGLQGMNVFNVQEKTWGYRSVEKSVMDKFKFSSSADLGIGYYNIMNKINYSVLITNGSGYNKPENDSNKKISAQVFYGEQKLSSKAGVNIGAIATYEPYKDDENKDQNTTVAGVFAGFANSILRFGTEVDKLMDSSESDNALLISGYGDFKYNELINVFARIDNISVGVNSDMYFIGGISIAPDKGIKIIPNIRHYKPEEGDAVSTYNLTFEFKTK